MKYLTLLFTLLCFCFSATITVNDAGDTTNNDGKCTLREAIINANNNTNTHTDCTAIGTYGNDTIVFSSSLDGQTITLGSSLPINFTGGNLTIDAGSVKITISGNSSVQLFSLSGNGTIELKNLNLIGGSATDGSLISLSAGQTLKLSNCFVGYNDATGNGTIYNNGGTVEIVNCTFSQNSAASGSVVYNNTGISRLSFITSADNAGVPLHQVGGSLLVKNSIFLQSSGNVCTGTVNGFGVVFATDITNCTGFTSKTNTELALDTLDFHGGNTRVYKLSPSSHAINAVTDCTDIAGNSVAKDQRGKDRNKNGKKCDVGAFELLLSVNVSVSPSGSGSVSGAGEYEKDATANLSATANSGFEFEKWLGDCSGTTATLNLTVDNNKTCTAQFKATSGGSTSPPPSTSEPPSSNIPLPNQQILTSPSGSINVQSDARITSTERFDINSFGLVPPPGYSATYGVIKIRLQSTSGFATIRIIFPRAIPIGSKVYKIVGSNLYDITSQVSIQGSVLTFLVYDNSQLDGDSIAGTIEDPILLLENQNPPAGGGGGCSAGAGSSLYGWLAILFFAYIRRLRR